MNAPARRRSSWLRAALSKWRGIWGPILGTVSARLPPWGSTHIIIRPVSGGFSADLYVPYWKKVTRVHWREESSSWQPEAPFRRLARTANERPIILELPPELTLAQAITLPRAALTNLSEAIGYGLSSWSPFDADEVYVKGRVDEVQAEHARILLTYARKAKVDPLLARVAATGFPADHLILDMASNQVVALSTPKLARLRKNRTIDGALAITALLLALLLGSLRVTVLSQKLTEAEGLLRTELAQFRQAEALQAAYASFSTRQAVVSERLAREVGVYEILAALGRHLPENVLIQALEIDEVRGRIDLSGADPEVTLSGLRHIPVFRNLRIEPPTDQGIVTVIFETDRIRS